MDIPGLMQKELALLGALIWAPHRIAETARTVPLEAIIDDPARKLYATLIELSEARESVDPINDDSVARHMTSRYGKREPGWVVWLWSKPIIAVSPGGEAMIPGFAKIIREGWLQREAHRIGSEIPGHFDGAVTGHADEVLDAVNWLQAQTAELSRTCRPAVGGPAAQRVSEFARWCSQSDPEPTGTETGVGPIDRYLRALEPGRLYTVAARPGVGKSTLALQIALNAALARRSVLFASCEMSERELYTAMLANLASVDSERIARRSMGPDQRERVDDATLTLMRTNLELHETPRLAVSGLHSLILRAAHRTGHVDLVLVDYVQLMDPGTPKSTPRHQQLAAITQGLKALARETPTAIIMLAQLSRAAEGIDAGLEHLKESGSIEEDSDVVALFWRDRERWSQRIICGKIAKNRHGRTGRFELRHELEFRRFVTLPDCTLEGPGGDRTSDRTGVETL